MAQFIVEMPADIMSDIRKLNDNYDRNKKNNTFSIS